ncbi:MAG TPA: AtzH-like domain-containing protein [Pyrinomonadaceae bacterium]|jgi:ketosteroid isomerase-like protein|nr:AtzH-like domain-containing protein [Pyrinomonadaceae bacterium]
MFNRLLIILALTFTLAASALAQNTNTSTTRSRTTTKTTTTKTPVTTGEAQAETPPTTTPAPARTTTTTTTRTQRSNAAAETPAAKAVRAAFDALIDGITRADVDAVMNAYWNSPQLVLFNNNGTVTRSWAQVRANRQSSYPNLKDVKIAVRDVRVQMLGADGALVSCLWTQTQNYKGTDETATGRLSLVFRRTGNVWKVVHTHTSPDKPDPSLLLPSEQDANTAKPAATTTTPAKP